MNIGKFRTPRVGKRDPDGYSTESALVGVRFDRIEVECTLHDIADAKFRNWLYEHASRRFNDFNKRDLVLKVVL